MKPSPPLAKHVAAWPPLSSPSPIDNAPASESISQLLGWAADRAPQSMAPVYAYPKVQYINIRLT